MHSTTCSDQPHVNLPSVVLQIQCYRRNIKLGLDFKLGLEHKLRVP